MRTDNLRRLSMCDYENLHVSAELWWENCTSNAEVVHKLLDRRTEAVKRALNPTYPMWLERALSLPAY